MKKILCLVAMVIMISAFLPVHTTVAAKKISGKEKKKEVSVYVVSNIKRVNGRGHNYVKHNYFYSYTADGKISKIKDKDTHNTWKYKYSKNNFTQCKHYGKNNKLEDYNSYTYDKKGRVSKLEKKGPMADNQIYTYSYNSAGYCNKIIEKNYDEKTIRKLKYYKNGLLKDDGYCIYNYDKHKMIKKEKQKEGVTIKYSNTYKKGRLAKTTAEKYFIEVKYKYKKIKVPSDKAAMVKAQQRWIFRTGSPEFDELEAFCK